MQAKASAVIRLTVIGAMFWLTLPALRLAAQAEPRHFRAGMRTAIGYTAALPETQLGVGAFHFLGSTRTAIFADWKITVGSLQEDENYCPTALAECVVDWVERERNDFRVRDEE